jgi:metal-responsive CopG/Arc/MetJ family transcriptional regulator
MARPATGQTPVVTFRPPQQLRDEFDQEAKASGRTRSDALIEAMHDWLRKRQRERPVSSSEETTT